jgi:hypothetical protein
MGVLSKLLSSNAASNACSGLLAAAAGQLPSITAALALPTRAYAASGAGKYSIIDHEYDAVVVGAGGAAGAVVWSPSCQSPPVIQQNSRHAWAGAPPQVPGCGRPWGCQRAASRQRECGQQACRGRRLAARVPRAAAATQATTESTATDCGSVPGGQAPHAAAAAGRGAGRRQCAASGQA